MRYELPLPLSSLGFGWKERRQALRHWDRFSWQSITWTHYVPYDLQLIREQFSLSVLTSTDQCFEITLTEKHPSALQDIAARYSQGRLLHYAFQELKMPLLSVVIYLLWLTPIASWQDNSMTGCYSKSWKAWQLTLYYLERYLVCCFDRIFHINPVWWSNVKLMFSTRNQIGAQIRYFNDSCHLCDWNILHINTEQSWETLKERQCYGRVGWSPWESLRPKVYWWTVSNRQGSTHNNLDLRCTAGVVPELVFFQKCSSSRKQWILLLFSANKYTHLDRGTLFWTI